MATSGAEATSPTFSAPSQTVKTFRCTWGNCNKSFSRAEHLNRHALNHDSVKANITCERCNAVFKRKDLLERHLNRHKEKDEEAGGEGLGKLQTRKRLWRDSTGAVVATTRPEHEKRRKSSERRLSAVQPFEESGSYFAPSSMTPITPPGSSHDRISTGSDSTDHSGYRHTTTPREEHWSSSLNPDKFLRPSVAHPEPMEFLLNASWGTQFQQISEDELLYNGMFMPDTASSFNNPFTTPSYYTWLFGDTNLSPSEIETNGSGSMLQSTLASTPQSADGQILPQSNFPTISPPLDILSPETSAANQILSLSQHKPSSTTTTLGYPDPIFWDNSIQEWPRSLPRDQISDKLVQQSVLSDLPQRGKLPVIDINARERIVDLVNRAGLQVSGGTRITPDHRFLTLHILQEFCDLYFTRFNISYPLIHQATFNPTSVDPLLLLSIILLGATYSGKEEHLFAINIHDTMRAQILASSAFNPRPTLWILQTILLVECFGKSRAGQLQHDMSHLFHGLLINLIRRSDCQSAITQVLERGADLDTHWKAEVDAEQRRRLALLCFMWDTQHAILFSQSLCMNAAELKLTLPWNSSLWEAETAEEFYSIFTTENPQPFYLSTLKTYISPKTGVQAPQLNALSRVLMLHGLMSVAWDLNRRDQTSLGLTLTSKDTTWQTLIARSYDAWKVDFDTYTTSILSSHPPGSPSYVSFQKFIVDNLAIYHAAHIILHVEIIDLQIFAGASHIIGRAVTRTDHERSTMKIQKWVKTIDGAAKAVVHAARILRDGMTKLKDWDAGDVFHYPWCLYLATLTVWAFQVCNKGVKTNETAAGIIGDEDSEWDAQAETMALVSSLTRSNTEDLGVMAGKYRTADLPRVMARHLSTIRWAVVQEGMIVLRELTKQRHASRFNELYSMITSYESRATNHEA